MHENVDLHTQTHTHTPVCMNPSTLYRSRLIESHASTPQHTQEPFASGDEGALDRLRNVLAPILLRRTKNSRDVDGKPIVELPERRVQVCVRVCVQHAYVCESSDRMSHR